MSLKTKTLYIDTGKSPRSSLVRALATNTPARADDIIVGDEIKYNIAFVNGGAIDGDIAGNANYTLKFEVGNLGESVLAYSDQWAVSASMFTGSVSYATDELTGSLEGEDSINTYMEVTLTHTPTGISKKYLQVPMVVWNEVNSSGTSPTPSAEYWTKTESDGRYLLKDFEATSSFFQGGNSFGTTATLGTSDNYNLSIITNNTEKVIIEAGGNVGIGANPVGSKLLVSGLLTATTANITNGITTTNMTASSGILTTIVTGSVGISTPLGLFTDVKATRLTGSLHGTSSWANRVVNTDFTSSWATNASTASFLPIGTYPVTSSWANNVKFTGKSDNYLPRWDSNTLSSISNVHDDGDNIGIGGLASGTAKLYVYGTIRAEGHVTASSVEVTNGTNTGQLVAGTSSLAVAGVGTTITTDQTTHLLFGASTAAKSVLRIPVGTGPTVPSSGDVWNSTINQLAVSQLTLPGYVSTTVQKQTSTVSRNSATSGDQALFSPVITFPADYLKIGQVIRVKASGFHSVVTPPTHSIQIKLAVSGASAVTVMDFGTIAMGTTTSNAPWNLEIIATIRSTGASGTLVADGRLTYGTGTGTPTLTSLLSTSNGVVTFDTTAAQTLLLTVALAGGDASDKWDCQTATVEIV